MLIGEIVRQTGLSRDTIRYYERLGLLRAGGRPSPANNYKDYPASTVLRLGLIQQAKKLGFSLAESAEWLDLLTDTGLSDKEAAARIAKKLALIEAKMQALIAIRDQLLYFQHQIATGHCSLQVPLAERPTSPPDLVGLFGRLAEVAEVAVAGR